MGIEYKDSKRIVANEADVAVISNRGTIDFTGGLGNTDADDVAHFESTGQLNKIIGEKIESGNSLIGQTVTKLQFKLFRMDNGTISDTLTFGVWDFATGDLKTNGSFGTVRIDSLVYNASSSHSNAQKVTLVHSGSGVTIATNDIIGIRSNVDTMTSKRVEVAQHDDASPDSYANGARCIFVEGANSPSSTSGKDIWFQAGTSSGNTIITFTGNGTFTPTSAFDVEYLVIAGGGGGGIGGGAGAGGFRTATGFGVTSQNYNITVGAGGLGYVNGDGSVPGKSGEDSIFSTITSTGGGGGGYADQDGVNGGSGSGSGGNSQSGTARTGGISSPVTSPVQGYAGGGWGGHYGAPYASAGGGGSSAVGQDRQSTSSAGNGGAGTASSISGSSVTYAGGGGGGAHVSGASTGSGGSGGGGNGSTGGTGSNATGYGSGGGGGNAGGNGSQGIVIIKFATSGNTYSTSAGGKPTDLQDNSILVEKETAKRYWFTGESTSETESTGTYAVDFPVGSYDNDKQGFCVANTSSSVYGKTISSVSFWLKRGSSTSGTAYIRVWSGTGNGNAGTQVHEFGSIALSALTTSFVKHTFSTGSHTLAVDDTVGVEYAGGSISTSPVLQGATTDVYDGVNTIRNRNPVGGTFSPVSSHDVKFAITETTPATWTQMPPILGLGLFCGGNINPPRSAQIDRITIATTGNSTTFGDLITARYNMGSVNSETRAVIGTGSGDSGVTTGLEYITTTTPSNAIAFGTTSASSSPRHYSAGVSNNTYGLFGGGYSGSNSNIIDYVTIATPSNAIDFGNLASARRYLSAVDNGTRGIWGGGTDVYTSRLVQYVTIGTSGTCTSAGDLLINGGRSTSTACHNDTRGVFMGGDSNASGSTGHLRTMDYLTMASLGTAGDFGDLSETRNYPASCHSDTRGVLGGGLNGSTIRNTMEYITIATTGNSVSFGDLQLYKYGMAGTQGS